MKKPGKPTVEIVKTPLNSGDSLALASRAPIGPRNRTGRVTRRDPTIWTPERIEAVCVRLRRHEPYEPACWAEGGSPLGLNYRIETDPIVADAVAAAKGEGQRTLLEELTAPHEKSEGDWRREAWLAERLYPKQFHLIQKVEQTSTTVVSAGAPAPTTREAALALLKQLEADVVELDEDLTKVRDGED